MRALWLVLSLAACGSVRARVEEVRAPVGTVWVVAPHPDDEILMAAHALSEALRAGTPYEVVIVTNGDFTCTRNGWARQEESLAALASIGVSEEHVHFLGYPDGWLANLGTEPLPAIPRTARDGSCGTGEGTYGDRGAEHADVHRARTGQSAPYTSAALTSDLVALFSDHPPSEIHLPHAIDAHPDHAMTYAYVRRALSRAQISAMLVRHLVHAGPCWPASDEQGTCIDPTPLLDTTPLPPLPPPLTRYRPDRIEAAEPRRAAIGHYLTQLEGPLETSWLASFSRTTEVAWLEPIARGEGPIDEAGSVDGERWRGAIELSARIAHDGSIELRSGTDRYVVRALPERIELGRVSASGEALLRGMEAPFADERRIALRVIPIADGFVSLEVHGPEGFLLGAIDAAGIRAGEGFGVAGGATDARLVALSPH